MAAWQQDRISDGGARGLATAVSIDGGATWSRPQPSPFSQCAGGTFARVSDPWVAASGTVVLQIGIAFTGAELTTGARSAVLASRSSDGGVSWRPAVPLIDDDGSRFFNDKEALTIDSTDARYVYAVWDALDADDHGVTALARSTDGGVSWSPATAIYDPGASRQTIGNVAVTTPDGVVHVFFVELGPSPTNPTIIEGHLAVMRSANKARRGPRLRASRSCSRSEHASLRRLKLWCGTRKSSVRSRPIHVTARCMRPGRTLASWRCERRDRPRLVHGSAARLGVHLFGQC